jgi:hypothetical protein
VAKKPDKPKAHAEPAPLIVKDVHHAPILYFEGAPNFGNNHGIINVTLAAARHVLEGNQIASDIVAVAYLRCNAMAAMALRQALDDALLLGAPTGSGPVN